MSAGRLILAALVLAGAAALAASGQTAVPVCAVPDRSFVEGDSGTALFHFRVTCDQALTQDVSFHVTTADGTASDGADYMGIDGNGSVAAGQSTIGAEVQIVGDTEDEPDALQLPIQVRQVMVRAHLLELAGGTTGALAHNRAAAGRTTSLPERHYVAMRAARLTPHVASDDGSAT